jgi:hypothetical protein
MGTLNGKQRKALPRDSFALPGGGPAGADAYPLAGPDGRPSQAHAVAALARVAKNGTPAEKREVRAAVRKKFPGLPSSQGNGGSQAAAHNQRVDRRAGKSRAS